MSCHCSNGDKLVTRLQVQTHLRRFSAFISQPVRQSHIPSNCDCKLKRILLNCGCVQSTKTVECLSDANENWNFRIVLEPYLNINFWFLAQCIWLPGFCGTLQMGDMEYPHMHFGYTFANLTQNIGIQAERALFDWERSSMLTGSNSAKAGER